MGRYDVWHGDRLVSSHNSYGDAVISVQRYCDAKGITVEEACIHDNDTGAVVNWKSLKKGPSRPRMNRLTLQDINRSVDSLLTRVKNYDEADLWTRLYDVHLILSDRLERWDRRSEIECRLEDILEAIGDDPENYWMASAVEEALRKVREE